ncbi:uncharacterized protein VTP21DRAFT_272 [Calcarisporiella thermophila]|uniref:uncharacterized protein n=1 Tax=Calcarisporiella thermophila TaxID=911321 RepID=UPI0037424D21
MNPSAIADIRYRKTSHAPLQDSHLGVEEKGKPGMFKEVQNGSSKRKVRLSGTSHLQHWINITGLVLIAMVVRLYMLNRPDSVVFDEVHFGGFASKYINRKFFFDVHPPLAKLLIAGAAKLAGFDGSFDFKEIGMDYIAPKVPYVYIRLLPAAMGIALVPMAYLTIKFSGHSTASAMLAALLITFENALTTQSRHILLDSPLIFFTGATNLMWVNWFNQRDRPFSPLWWFWLSMTGVCLGLTASCKWVGLFMIATIGLSTVKNLWDMWGDLRVSLTTFAKHFIARAICLIVIPALVYMSTFKVHFWVLKNSGDGDGFMTAEFQKTLAGNEAEPVPLDIAYGSEIVLRHRNTQGGYLHSHSHLYPSGSKQQQITLYPHRDENNVWIIERRNASESSGSELDWVKNGDIVRLVHKITKMRLHSHEIRPPVTDRDYHNEVSGYGFPGFDGDANDDWKLEITEHEPSDPESKDRLHAINSKFRLIHMFTGCHLFSHTVQLPEWGFGQQEVTCIKSGKYPNTVWYVENNSHPKLSPDAPKVNYRKPTFFQKFLELNKVMWDVNNKLTGSHPFDSRPPAWPILRRGISYWGKQNTDIYLLGNPLTWWSSTLAVMAYGIYKIIMAVSEQRGYRKRVTGNLGKHSLYEFYNNSAGYWFMGWALHFFPFFLMSRQLFLHHYLPALYFAIMLLSVCFDFAVYRLSARQRLGAMLICVIVVALVFRQYAPITYGLPWTKGQCQRSKLLRTWDYDCNKLPEVLPTETMISTESPAAGAESATLSETMQNQVQSQSENFNENLSIPETREQSTENAQSNA